MKLGVLKKIKWEKWKYQSNLNTFFVYNMLSNIKVSLSKN